MAQKIVTICDHHMESGNEDVPGTPYEMAGYQIDLCDDCAKTLSFADGVMLAQQFGRRASSQPVKKRVAVVPARADGDLSCVYGCNKGRQFASIQGLRQHHTRAHKDKEPQL